ncbi:hypothetical protein FPY71_00460 [Aureimonas fodinaquatilis]|uniref:Uncharacterized protein n=1 Tax=Aureimonas fodinaquatilis TaxID=2565783 RepID=A0A5B0DYY6_9HYPH|nr:hypothetical protein [Aureimonas fodinaquatilis]KAA0971646.1 hypothetical protein FPY71_00460 [Aureimonas fodinaquatilis]
MIDLSENGAGMAGMSVVRLFGVALAVTLLSGCGLSGDVIAGGMAQASANLAQANHNLMMQYGSCREGLMMTERGCEVPSLRYNSRGRAYVADGYGGWIREPAYD